MQEYFATSVPPGRVSFAFHPGSSLRYDPRPPRLREKLFTPPGRVNFTLHTGSSLRYDLREILRNLRVLREEIYGGFAPFHPQLLFLLIEKVTKKIKACTTSFSLTAKFIPFATGGAQGDLLKYFRSFPSPYPPSTAQNKLEVLRAGLIFSGSNSLF